MVNAKEAQDAARYQQATEAGLRGHDRIIALKAIAHALLYYTRKFGMPTEELHGLLHRMRVARDGGGPVIVSVGGHGSKVGSPDNPNRATRRQINAALRVIYEPYGDTAPRWITLALGAWALNLAEPCGMEREALVERLIVLDKGQRLESSAPRAYIEATEKGGTFY